MAHRVAQKLRDFCCRKFPRTIVEAPKPMNRTDSSQTKNQKKVKEVNAEQGDHSIFEVPGRLKKLEPAAFRPDLVSIGPYHRDKDHLMEMEKLKKRLLEHVIKQKKTSLESLKEEMSKLEQNTRNCYDKGIPKKDFVEMMLLDACFILELINGCKDEGNPLRSIKLRGSLPFIQSDLLMLENQIPFSVLDKMFEKVSPESDESVADLALKFFKPVIPGTFENLSQDPTNEPPLHLLDIVHQSLKPSQLAIEQYSETSHCSTILLPHFCNNFCAARNAEEKRLLSSSSDPPEILRHSVTRLRGTGIEFVKNEKSKKFTDVEFEDGKLLIPRLLIHGSTKSTFLNLMTFEQCYPYRGRYITSYISFIDRLVDSSKDAEHLIEKQIITHELGSAEDVATLINNLRRETVFDISDDYLSDVSQKLDKHCQQKWRTWMAILKHQYLKDPWKVISLGAAISLFILTVRQTGFTKP